MSKKITRFGKTCLTYVLIFAMVLSFVMSSFVGLDVKVFAEGESTGGTSNQSLDSNGDGSAAPTVDYWDGTTPNVDTAFADQTGKGGSAETPYEITTGAQLYAATRCTDTGVYFKLMNDIVLQVDAAGLAKVEALVAGGTDSDGLLGWDYSVASVFYSNFDGNFKTVSGLYVSTSLTVNQGLFQTVAGPAVIKNLTIKDSYIKGGNAVGTLAGGVCNWSNNGSGRVTVSGVRVEDNYLESTQTGNGGGAGGFFGVMHHVGADLSDLIYIEGAGNLVTAYTNRVGTLVANYYSMNGRWVGTSSDVVNENLGLSINRLVSIGDEAICSSAQLYKNNSAGWATGSVFETSGVYCQTATTDVGNTYNRKDRGNTWEIDWFKFIDSAADMQGEKSFTAMPEINFKHGWVVLGENQAPTYVGAENIDKYDYIVPAWDGTKTFTLDNLAGSGTETDPYLIFTGAEFYAAVNMTEGSYHFKLMNDIKLQSDANMLEIAKLAKGQAADTSTLNKWFESGTICNSFRCRSTFDGNFKTVSGFYINNSAASWGGIFGDMYDGTNISNLTIKDSYVNGGGQLGILFGRLWGNGRKYLTGVTIENCYLKGTGACGAFFGVSPTDYANVYLTDCSYIKGEYGDVVSTAAHGVLYGDTWGRYTFFLTRCLIEGVALTTCTNHLDTFNSGTAVYSNVAPTANFGSKITTLNDADMKGRNAYVKMPELIPANGWIVKDENSYPIFVGKENVDKYDYLSVPLPIDALQGEGTAESPKLIYTAEELMVAVNNTALIGENNDQIPYFKLMNDIVVNDISDIDSWDDNTTGLLNWSATEHFVGHLDGNYKEVIGLYMVDKVSKSSWDSFGFIKRLQSGSSLKNLTLRDGYVSAGVNMNNGRTDIGILVGGLPAKTDITIDGCVVHDFTAKNNSAQTGALIGRMWDTARLTISNCATYNIVVVGNTVVGGIYSDGWNCWDGGKETTKINNCFTSGMPIAQQDGTIRFSNVYTDWSETFAFGLSQVGKHEYENVRSGGIAYMPTATMKSEKSVSAMGLPYEKWKAIDGNYPELKEPITFDLLNGEGTLANPYEITNVDELMFAVNNTEKIGENKDQIPYFKIMNDIEINDISNISSWDDNTVGLVNWSAENEFVGHLDGNHKDITGLYLVCKTVPSSWQSTGFIKQIASGGSVSNINLSYGYVSGGARLGTGTADIGVLFGGLQNKTDITVSGCVVHDFKVKNDAAIGGLFGRFFNNARVTVSNCAVYNMEFEHVPNSADSTFIYGGLYSDGWSNWDNGKYTVKFNDCFVSGLPIARQHGDPVFTNVYTDWDETYAFGYKRDRDTYENTRGGGLYYIATEKMMGKDAVDNMKFKAKQWKARANDYPECIVLPYNYNGVPGSAWSGGKALTFAGGDGTADHPWEIDTVERLVKMIVDYQTEEHWFVITEDLVINDASAPDWYTSGLNTDWLKGNIFVGHVDGRGHTITGLYIDNTGSSSAVGLIQKVNAQASISNINIDKCYITSPNNTAGILVGSTTHDTFTKIAGCNVSNAIIDTCYGVGGIIGGSSIGMCVVDYCTFEGELIGALPSSRLIGGIVADSWGNIIISNCISKGLNAVGQLCGTVYAVYSDVAQKDNNARDLDADINVLKPEQMVGTTAKTYMTDLNWDVMKTDKNGGVPTYDGLVDLSDEALAGKPGKVWSGFAANKYAGGTGTETDPYIIETPEQLYRFSLETMSLARSEDLYFKITEDIYLNDVFKKDWKNSDDVKNWLAASYFENGVERYFKGHLDGDYHVVYGMYHDVAESGNAVGIIPRIHEGATIKRLGVSEAFLSNGSGGNTYVSPFVGYVERLNNELIDEDEFNAIKFSECFVDDTVELYSSTYAGGFVASSRVKVEFDNCYSNVYIDRKAANASAFIGDGYYGTVKHPFLHSNCYAKPQSTWTKFSRIPTFQQETSRENIIPEGTIDNCYYYGSNAINVEPLDYTNMRGDKAKEYMKGFDFENVWMTVDGGTPVLRHFANAAKFSDDKDVYSTITFFTGTEDIKIPEMKGIASSPVTLPVPEREGYFFDGWYVFSNYNIEYDFGIFPVEDIGLYAKWITNSVSQNFENYSNTEYDFSSDYQYYRPGVLDYTGDKVHGGGKAMLRLGKTDKEEDFILNADDPVAVGEEYKIRFWVASDVANTKATISLVHYTWPDYQDPNLGAEKLIDYQAKEVGEWTVYTCKFKAKTPWIGIRTTGNARIFFDDFFILPADGVMDDTNKTNDYDYFYSLGETEKTESTKSEKAKLFAIESLGASNDSVESRTVSVAVLATVLLAAASLVVLSKVYFSNLEKSFKGDVED